MRRYLFLDRDATLIRDTVYPRDPAAVELLPGAAEAVGDLARRGFTVAVVSNQSGVARGFITPAEAAAVDARFVALFAEASGVTLTCWYCFHGPDDGCDCRKPKPGLLLQAAKHFGDPIGPESVTVGDKPTDLAAGRVAGCGLTLLFGGDWPAVHARILERTA